MLFNPFLKLLEFSVLIIMRKQWRYLRIARKLGIPHFLLHDVHCDFLDARLLLAPGPGIDGALAHQIHVGLTADHSQEELLGAVSPTPG